MTFKHASSNKPKKKNSTLNVKIRPNNRQVIAAFTQLLKALGVNEHPEMAETPKRAAELWLKHLLAGEQNNLANIIRKNSISTSSDPICLLNIGVHLVCPHHLTVGFGYAHIAYIPKKRVVGFGSLTRLVTTAAARFALQEDITNLIADALMQQLEADAVIAVIDAIHPCHNLKHPRSHQARAVTWAIRGPAKQSKILKTHVRDALCFTSKG
ncbi:MAG: GTP cyclohydrolase I [Deltaproteobacteria bacterium]|nr:GTP cyclohydrolase I [Deltaproteobacteria bacterium]